MDQTEIWDTEFWCLSEQLRMWYKSKNNNNVPSSKKKDYIKIIRMLTFYSKIPLVNVD